MCTTPKSSKAAKPRSRSSVTNPDSYRNNRVEMQQASNHFDEFDRDAEQFRRLAQNKNKAKIRQQSSSDEMPVEPSSQHTAQAASWIVQFQNFWRRHF